MLCERWKRHEERRNGFHHWARGESSARSDLSARCHDGSGGI